MNKVESPQDAIFCTVRIDQTKQINENETLNLSANISEQNTESYDVSYQWMIYRNSNSWENINEATIIELSLNNVDFSYNGAQFKLVVTYSKKIKMQIGYSNATNTPINNKDDTTSAAEVLLKFISKKLMKLKNLKSLILLRIIWYVM